MIILQQKGHIMTEIIISKKSKNLCRKMYVLRIAL